MTTPQTPSNEPNQQTQPTVPLQQTQPYPPAAPTAPAPSYQAPQPAAARPALPTTVAQTNAFALIAIILAFIQPIAGIVFGHMALSQIKRNGDTGRGLALTGLIVGYVYVAFLVMFVIFYISMIFIMIGSLGSLANEIGRSGFDDYSY